jgi:hypothetical protein
VVCVGEWLSLVEHLVRDQGVGGSNPLSPTIYFIGLRAFRTVNPDPLGLHQVTEQRGNPLILSHTLMCCVLGFGQLQVQRNAFPVDEHHAAVD